MVLLDTPQYAVNYKLKNQKGRIKPIWNQLNGVTNKIVPIFCTALLKIKILIKLGQFSKYSIYTVRKVFLKRIKYDGYQVWPKVSIAGGAFWARIFAIICICKEFGHHQHSTIFWVREAILNQNV